MRISSKLIGSAFLLAALAFLARAQEKPPKPERVGLWHGRAPTGDGKFEDAEAWLTVHRPAKPNGTAIVICPGGGYAMQVVGAEGHGIAAWLNRHRIRWPRLSPGRLNLSQDAFREMAAYYPQVRPLTRAGLAPGTARLTAPTGATALPTTLRFGPGERAQVIE